MLYIAFDQCGNERREYYSEFLLFYLRWSRSRIFTPAPAPTGSGSATLHAEDRYPVQCTVYIRLDEHWDLVETIGELSGAIDEKPYSLCH